MDLNKQVNTAGAFILINGLFVFMVGPNQKGDLCVVRLGGHKENNEIAEECLKREIQEEVSINVTLVNSPITYYLDSWNGEPSIIEQNFKTDKSPIIITGSQDGPLSILYFAYSDQEPVPDSETHGILFLKKEDIDLICKEKITIDDFLKSGGKALFQKELRRDVILRPGVHLRFLSTLDRMNHNIIDNFIGKCL